MSEEVTVVRVPLPEDITVDAADLIRAAVESVVDVDSPVKILLDAGVYRLFWEENRSGKLAMVHIWRKKSWIIEGAVDEDGDPVTILEMQLPLENEIHGSRHFDIRDCEDFQMKNIIIDHNPRAGTAAKVIQVDLDSSTVTIEVFEGMPHFDGMACFSANNWDLTTRDLIKGPSVTRGVSHDFPRWTHLDGRKYTVTDATIAQLVKVGEGLSFHFNVVTPQGRAIDVYRCTDVRFENIFVYSSIGMVMGAGDNKNMVFQRFHIRPEGNSLAVGPRDGIHVSRSGGTLLMDDVYVKGVRWDPLVIYMNMAHILERVDDVSVRLDTSDPKAKRFLKVVHVGGKIDFWTGVDPTVRVVSSVTDGLIEFTEALDPSVQSDSIVTPGEWHWNEAIIRNSRVESNDGSGLIYESDNLLVENCVFRNNFYSNIGLGPTSLNAGMFVRNVTIRNNVFEASTWDPKYGGSYLKQQRGTITLFNHNPAFEQNEIYHRQITVEGNLFKDLVGTNEPAAVDVKLAKSVTIRNNQFINVVREVLVDPITTVGVSIIGNTPSSTPAPTPFFPPTLAGAPTPPLEVVSPISVIAQPAIAWPSAFVASPSLSIGQQMPVAIVDTPNPSIDSCNLVVKGFDPCDDYDTCPFYVNEEEGYQTCVWLRTRPDWWPTLCAEEHEARAFCGETCFVCGDSCQDEPRHQFEANGITRSCAWLSLRPHFHEEFCVGETLSSCSETCDFCPTAVPQPTPHVFQESNPPVAFIDIPTEQPIEYVSVPAGLCFSGDALVEVQGKGLKEMRHVGIGDSVKVNHNSDQYERIYAFAHRDVEKKAMFLRLLPSKLELSKDHLVFIAGRGAIPASMIRPGDTFIDGQKVEEIQTIAKDGVYAPLTRSGTILVNGVVASNYVTLQGSPVLEIGSLKTPFTFHWLEHAFQFPHRVWCCYLGFEDLGISEQGFGRWVEEPYSVGLWVLEQHALVAVVLLLPVVLTLGLFEFIEMVTT